MTIELWLDWPAKELLPNASRRLHWAKRAKVAKAHRQLAWAEGLRAGLHALFAEQGRYAVDFEFSAPDRRKRDTDNMIASVKAYIDGIADAIGVDDNRFRLSFSVAEPGRGDIRVRVTVSGQQ